MKTHIYKIVLEVRTLHELEIPAETGDEATEKAKEILGNTLSATAEITGIKEVEYLVR